MIKPAATGYAQSAEGLRVYYEVHGRGEPRKTFRDEWNRPLKVHRIRRLRRRQISERDKRRIAFFPPEACPKACIDDRLQSIRIRKRSVFVI